MLKECKDQICVELSGDDIIRLIQGNNVVGEGYMSDVVVVYKRNK